MKKIKFWVITVLVIAVIITLFAALINYGNQYTEHEYKLTEVSDGVYGYYYRISSRVPAENCECITLCCNGQVLSFKGDVGIVYSDEEPRVFIKSYNIHNGDEITVYVPQGTIFFQENLGV